MSEEISGETPNEILDDFYAEVVTEALLCIMRDNDLDYIDVSCAPGESWRLTRVSEEEGDTLNLTATPNQQVTSSMIN